MQAASVLVPKHVQIHTHVLCWTTTNTRRSIHKHAHTRMHVTADGRWMEPAAAVAWIQSKLRAAEALWEQTQPPHVDYALVMDGDEDEAFFMTDYAQE